MQHHQSARQNYLQAEVHTATPQKLQLMLVEAAIKNIHRTKLAWQGERYDEGIEALSRAQDIIAEILCSLDVKSNEQIAKKLASIYLFIFRSLAEGGMSHDEQKLDDALRVLNAERETWRLVCEKFGANVEQTPAAGGSIGAAASRSAEFTPSEESATYSGSTKLDLSSGTAAGTSGAKVLVPPPTQNTSTTFARPGGTSFAQSVKPLGAIQTNSSLATPKPAAPSTSGLTQQDAKPATPKENAGTGWDA